VNNLFLQLLHNMRSYAFSLYTIIIKLCPDTLKVLLSLEKEGPEGLRKIVWKLCAECNMTNLNEFRYCLLVIASLAVSFKGRLSCVKRCLSNLVYDTYSIPCVCSKENKQENKKQDELIDLLLSLA
jgi:hypothetical protein